MVDLNPIVSTIDLKNIQLYAAYKKPSLGCLKKWCVVLPQATMVRFPSWLSTLHQVALPLNH